MLLSQVLEQMGLNDKEAKIYLACLELGPASILEIAKKAAINRVTAYYIIESLRQKNLISITIKKKKKLFVAAEPEEIIKLLKEKEEVFISILPQLHALNNLIVKKPRIRFYEGEEGIINVYKDCLRDKKEILAWGYISDMHQSEKIKNYINKEFLEQRIRYNILGKLITPDSQLAKVYKKHDKEQLRQTKLVSQKKYPFNNEILIYGNKVAFLSFGFNEYLGIIIESKGVAHNMRLIFDFFWENLKY